jgi:hypothetical protein
MDTARQILDSLVDQAHELDDLAVSFIEDDLGRHDWENNWKTLKNKGAVQERIQAWLQLYEIDHDPQAIAEYIDNLLITRPGKWR